MRNKIIYIMISLIILAGIILFVKYSSRKETIKTDTTYSTGNTNQLYKKGNDIITTKTKTFHNAVILNPSEKDSTYSYTKEDSTYKLSINIKPAPEGAHVIDYVLDLTTKELIRIDTIYQLRIDTLKIKEKLLKTSTVPFYDTFLFGAITTVLLITLILQFIP